MPDNLIRVELKGATADLGEILAIDVARLIEGVERSIAAGAASVLGRQLGVGRRGKAVELSTRLRLVSIEQGNSVDLLLRAPEDVVSDEEGQFELDVRTLGQLALEQVFGTLESDQPDPQVARTLVELSADIALGTRYDAIVFAEQGDGDRVVTLDPPRRDWIRQWLSAPRAREADETLAGTLVEADFESMTARLRDPYGRRIDVSFPEELSDQIQPALRNRAQFQAHVMYDPKTSTIRRVELREVLRGRQLELDFMTQRFLHGTDLETIIREQGIVPIEDPSSLRFTDATDEELDRFLAGLERDA